MASGSSSELYMAVCASIDLRQCFTIVSFVSISSRCMLQRVLCPSSGALSLKLLLG
jgi:hypothetical protein